MFVWTAERIRSLAPDEAAWHRARQLGHPPLWRQQAGHERAVWGECKGAGGSFYQTVIDFNGPAFRCSCPVKRPPCKHALALLLLLLHYPERFQVNAPEPAWVSQWLESRLKRQQRAKAPEPAAPDPDLAAQRQKNKDKRLELMAAGIQELDTWLRDLVRQGLANAQSHPPAWWEQTAARMMDAKLGGIARRLRLLAYPAPGKPRHEQILEVISELYLMVEGFKRVEQLPPPLAQDLLTAAGLATRKEDLGVLPSTTDHWLVMGVHEGVEEQLRFRRVWLYGAQQQRWALLLDFVWGDDNPFPGHWLLGSVYAGALTYYPSAYPLRAVAQALQPADEMGILENIKGYERLEDAALEYARALAANPWLPQMPVYLKGVAAVYRAPDFFLLDSRKQAVPLMASEDVGLQILSISGGHPINLTGEWQDGRLLPLAIEADGHLIPI